MTTKLNISVSKCISIAKSEYIKWICNPKILIFFVMLIFVNDNIIQKMFDAANEMGTRIMVAEPFIAISGSVLFIFVIPTVYLVLMGDFPKIDGNAMFYLQRAGKKNWLIGQLVFSIMASITYVIGIIICTWTCVASNCSYTNKWSIVTTKYTKFFPEKEDGVVANLITGRLYNNLKPYEALIISAVMVTLYMVFISMLLMTGFAIGKRTISIGVVGVILCIGSTTIHSDYFVKWLFPAAHTLLGIHYDLVYNKQIFPIGYSVLYMIILIVILLMLDYIWIDRYDYSKIEEMEE